MADNSSTPPVPPPIRNPKVEIQTMKEDLTRVKRAARVQKVASSPLRPFRQLAERDSAGKTASPAGQTAQTFPLPAEKAPDAAEGEQIIRRAPVQKGRGGRVAAFLVILLVVAVLGAASWWFFAGGIPGFGSARRASLSANTLAEAIPREALFLVRYTIQDPNNAPDILALWDSKERKSPTLATLLTGDPRFLLELGQTEFVYAVLPGDPRAYVVVARSAALENAVAQQSAVQGDGQTVNVLEVGNWMVLHQFDSERYEEALLAGTYQTLGGLPAAGASTHVQVLMSAAQFARIVQDISPTFADVSAASPLVISLEFSAADKIAAFSSALSEGTGALEERTSVSRLSQLIPADVLFSRFGSNFAQDVTSWQLSGLSLDESFISSDTVKEFIARLSGPYAYFVREGQDGVRDIGLAILLPEDLQKTVQITNSAVDLGVRALVPLVIESTGSTASTYTDTVYNGVTLRYINFLGYTQTIDYTVTDDFIFVSTSREGMYRMVDTILGSEPAMSVSPIWGSVLKNADAVFADPIHTVFVGYMSQPALVRLLPLLEGQQIPFSAGFGTTSGIIRGYLNLAGQE